MKTKEELLKALRPLKSEMMTRYRVEQIGLFGSTVRSEENETSDIDILVDFEEEATLFDLVGLAQFLEEKLQNTVDLVPRRALRPELRETILKEVEAI